MIRRALTLVAAVLIGLPWAVLPAVSGSPCAKGMPKSDAGCTYCAPDSRPAPAGATLSAGCCFYSAGSETAPLQASGTSLSPRPHHAPDAPVVLPAGSAGIGAPGAIRVALAPEHRFPAHAPPTETTRLLL